MFNSNGTVRIFQFAFCDIKSLNYCHRCYLSYLYSEPTKKHYLIPKHYFNTLIHIFISNIHSRIMVVNRGSIAEFDSPANLLLNKNSIFYSLAKEAGVV